MRFQWAFLPILILTHSSAPADTYPETKLLNLSKQYGPVFYAALHSLPEYETVFDSIERVEEWKLVEPSSFPVKDADTKLLPAALRYVLSKNRDEQMVVISKTGYWCAAYCTLFRDVCIFQKQHVETRIEIFFQIPETADLFDYVISGRRFAPDIVTPSLIAGTLTSGEHTALTYSILNRIAALGERDQIGVYMQYFERLGQHY